MHNVPFDFVACVVWVELSTVVVDFEHFEWLFDDDFVFFVAAMLVVKNGVSWQSLDDSVQVKRKLVSVALVAAALLKTDKLFLVQYHDSFDELVQRLDFAVNFMHIWFLSDDYVIDLRFELFFFFVEFVRFLYVFEFSFAFFGCNVFAELGVLLFKFIFLCRCISV